MTYTETLTPDTVRPRNHYAVVERMSETEKSEGGIHLPETMGEKNLACKLIRSGPGAKILREAEDESTEKVTAPALRVCQEGDSVGVRQFEGQRITPINRNFVITDGRLIFGRYVKKPWPQPERLTR